MKNKPFITADNKLHYWENELHKEYDLSNDAIEANSIKEKRYLPNGQDYEVEKIPKKIAKALLQTGEYYYIKGDRFNDYFSDVYHKCWEVKSHLPNFENIEHCGNVDSNPCYGWIRYKQGDGSYTEGEKCPRCRVIWAIAASYKPLKWKIWDKLIGIKERVWYFFHSIYKQIEVFQYVHSKEGKESLQKWHDWIAKGGIGALVEWRHQFLKPLTKQKDLMSCFISKRDGWWIWNPEKHSMKEINEKLEIYKKNDLWSEVGVEVIWEHFREPKKEKKNEAK